MSAWRVSYESGWCQVDVMLMSPWCQCVYQIEIWRFLSNRCCVHVTVRVASISVCISSGNPHFFGLTYLSCWDQIDARLISWFIFPRCQYVFQTEIWYFVNVIKLLPFPEWDLTYPKCFLTPELLILIRPNRQHPQNTLHVWYLNRASRPVVKKLHVGSNWIYSKKMTAPRFLHR